MCCKGVGIKNQRVAGCVARVMEYEIKVSRFGKMLVTVMRKKCVPMRRKMSVPTIRKMSVPEGGRSAVRRMVETEVTGCVKMMVTR